MGKRFGNRNEFVKLNATEQVLRNWVLVTIKSRERKKERDRERPWEKKERCSESETDKHSNKMQSNLDNRPS